MKYAILSDIHANLEALETVIGKCRELGIEQYLCLGDIVGYNANPKECIDLLRSLDNLSVVKGNHDEYVSNGDDEMQGFNPHAKAAVLWTRAQLSPDDLKWLSDLPYRQPVKGAGITLVHATLDSPESWGYIFDAHHAMDNFSYQFTPLCFCGHSHAPIAFFKRPALTSQDGGVREIPEWAWRDDEDPEHIETHVADALTIGIQPGWKYLINVGSVGQPRNRDPRASFAVYDSERRTISRWRVPYDIERAQAKIMEAGLPEKLATRLPFGK